MKNAKKCRTCGTLRKRQSVMCLSVCCNAKECVEIEVYMHEKCSRTVSLYKICVAVVFAVMRVRSREFTGCCSDASERRMQECKVMPRAATCNVRGPVLSLHQSAHEVAKQVVVCGSEGGDLCRAGTHRYVSASAGRAELSIPTVHRRKSSCSVPQTRIAHRGMVPNEMEGGRSARVVPRRGNRVSSVPSWLGGSP